MFFRIMTTVMAMLFAVAATAQDSYRIKAGDTLAVEVLEDATLNRSLLVLPDGSISVPLAGNIPASGRTTNELASRISAAIAPNFAAAPNVFVSVATVAPRVVGSSRTIDVFVMGEVNTPGAMELAPGTTILQALAQVGGFTKFAATNRIQLRRTNAAGEDKAYPFNYRAVEAGASISGSTRLADGDVIVIPQRRLFE